MNGEVQLIVGSTTTVTQQIVATFQLPGYYFTNPMPMGLFAAAPPNICTVGSTILLTDTDNPATWTVLATLTIDSSDPTAQEFTFTTGDYIDPDVVYWVTLYSTITTGTSYFLDLFENESISQNWKFQDLTNFSAQGAFSREFRVPYSDNNQLALGPLFDVNVEAGTANYFHYKLEAEIRVDTLPIATGYLRVRKVYRQKNRINEVELAFYAETPDLVRNIGEKKLADITDLTNINEVVQESNVLTFNSTRIWTILDRGQLWSEGGQLNTRSMTNPNTPVFAADLTPALRYDYLFEQIFIDAGFELVAGSLMTILSNYYMPWCNSNNIIASDSYNELFFAAYPSFQIGIANIFTTIPINTESFDNSNDFNTGTYTYIAPGGGWYTFRAIVKFSTAVIANPWDITVALSVNNSTAFNEMYIGSVTNGSIVDCNIRIALQNGDQVQLRVRQSNLQVNNLLFVDAGNSTYNSTLFELTKTEFFYDQTIYYNLNAPDAKQIDFVTDVIKMHNCAIVADRTVANKIYVVPQNSYLGSGDTLDWTSKLDIDKDIVISSLVDLQKAKFQFTYTAGEDVISKQYKNVNRVYGDYQATGYTTNPNTEPSDFAIGEQKIQLIMQSTPCGVVNGSGVIMPMFLNESLEFVAPGMRCLFRAGSTNVQFFQDSTSTVALTAIPLLNHYSQINADIDDQDLNWAPEVPTYNIIANPYSNLFNTYWRSYMNALYSPEARLMEASFALDLKDILTFKFSDKIWIQDSYWRILEVNDYKVGMNESTQVKLIKFIDNTEDCVSTPVSISTNGEVNFENGAGDPVEPSQDCCLRYGYNWDEVNAICWAFTPTGNRPTSGVTGTTTNPSPRPTKVAVQTRSITDSVIQGDTMSIAEGNKDMLAVGNTLELTKDTQGSSLLGKNVYTNLPGIHIGGGWKDGNLSSTEKGWAQTGILILHLKDTWLDAQTFNLNIEGIPGNYLELNLDTLWSCLMNVTILDTTTNNYCVGQYSFGLQKLSAGIVTATAITTLNEINTTAYAFVFGVDTVSTPAEARINLQVNGLGFLSETFIVTASLQYQQNTSV